MCPKPMMFTPTQDAAQQALSDSVSLFLKKRDGNAVTLDLQTLGLTMQDIPAEQYKGVVQKFQAIQAELTTKHEIVKFRISDDLKAMGLKDPSAGITTSLDSMLPSNRSPSR